MRLLADMRRKEEEERNRRSNKKSGGGCCSSIFFFVIAIAVLNHLSGPSDSTDDNDKASTTELASDELLQNKVRAGDYPQSSLQEIPRDAPSDKDEEESRLQRVRCNKTNSIHIMSLQMLNPNDDGGIDVGMVVKNTSGKTISKFKCLFAFYDDSGEMLTDEYSAKRMVSCVYTTPLAPNDIDMDKWVNVFTNESAERAVLRQITLYYEDGSCLEINDTSGL